MVKSTNPIMVDYLASSESLDAIVERCHNKNQYLELIFAKLTKEIHKEKIDLELLASIDKAILNGHPDTSLYLLFIAIAISYNNIHLLFHNAHSLISIGLSLNQDEIQPVVKALFTQHRANIYRRQGNMKECIRLMGESISFIDKNNPRYVVILNNTFFMIALQGKLKEYGKYQIYSYQWSTKNDDFLYPTELKIENAIITGNFVEGNSLVKEYKEKTKEEIPFRFKQIINTLQILSGDFNESNYQDKPFKCLVNSYKYLSMGKFEEAKKWHDLLVKEKIKRPILNDYFSFHLELCLGNKGMAKLLLQEKKQKGDDFYIDDLFYGRLQLLENDLIGADQSFARLIENVNRYDAVNRLNFELQFAKEMKLPDVLRLMNGWKPMEGSQHIKISDDMPVAMLPKIKEENILIGKSNQIKQVKNLVKKYAKLAAPILVTGETGTGKELVSRAIHDEGLHPKEPFLAINCGALTDSLLQSELFGYEAGAFTDAQKQRKGIFEAAGKGTVFLDEFGDISPKLQVSLLRVLESNEIRLIGSTVNRKIECKIVIATNVDLSNAVVNKKFREDLYFRLTKFEIKLPALRERREDLPELIQYFLDLNGNSTQRKKLSSELLNKLFLYQWPGNIRELKNEIDRLYILNPDVDILDVEHFDFSHLQNDFELEVKKSFKSTAIKRKEQGNDVNDLESINRILQKGFPVETRHNLIKELFKNYTKLTRTQIMEFANISTTTATKDLQFLIDSGFIVRRTPTKSSRTDYFELVN